MADRGCLAKMMSDVQDAEKAEYENRVPIPSQDGSS